MKPQDFCEAITFLSAATLADPFLALCSLTAWLDPLSIQTDSFLDDMPHEDEWKPIGMAWEIARICFPDVYAETTHAIRSQPNPHQLADQVCAAFNRHLIGGELHDLEHLYFGVPFFGMGIDLTDPDVLADPQYAPLFRVYAEFDLAFDPEQAYSIPNSLREAARIADVLASSLRQKGNPTHDKLAWLLDWMFSQTGNTVADYTHEEMYEMGIQPLAWEPDDLEFSNLMHTEAAEIIGHAMQGLDLLLEDASLQAELSANIAIASNQLRKVKHHDRHAESIANRLRWADRPQPTDEQRPLHNSQNLPLRGADAA